MGVCLDAKGVDSVRLPVCPIIVNMGHQQQPWCSADMCSAIVGCKVFN